MDILSSQANLAGYKAVVESFAYFEKAIPMMMTAAGTIPAAKVLGSWCWGRRICKLLQQQNGWVQLYSQQMSEWPQKNRLKV